MVGMKSDYRRAMSPITLAPKIINPWTNPMKRNIVASPYNPAATTPYIYGPTSQAAPTSSPAWYAWTNFAGMANVSGAHIAALQRWNVTPGVKVITKFTTIAAYLRNTHCSALYVEVWTETATDYVLVASSGAIAPAVGTTGADRTELTLATPLTVTLEAGKNYYVGLRAIRTNALESAPYICARTNGYAFAYNNVRFAVVAASWNGSTVSKTDAAGASYTQTDDEAFMQFINYTSTNLTEVNIASPAAKSYLVPSTTVPYVIKLETTKVDDTKSMTVALGDMAYNGTYLALETIKLDCGEASAGDNTLTCNTNAIALPDIGGVGQEGKYFDLVFGVRPATEKGDLYWQCRNLETNVHSHAVSQADARGALYTYATMPDVRHNVLTFSGTFAVDNLYVGTQPMVLIADSQTIFGNSPNMRTPNTNRLGAVPTLLSKPRIWILHGEPGQYLGYGASSVYSKIFNNATPGDGDGVELIGLRCDWMFSGIGVNDLVQETPTTDSLSKNAVTTMIHSVTTMGEHLCTANENIIVVGLPPYSLATGHAGYGKAVRWYNRALLGLALAWKCPFYNPWSDMVEPGTEDNVWPTFLLAYTQSSGEDPGLHYSTAGGAIVAANVVKAIENATIDLRDAWD